MSRPAIAFGPVPSRRLGRSIGINHIPPKTCSYACVYCQVGRTSRLRTARRAFYAEDDIVADVERRLDDARHTGETVDYLTFVPDGEPTLDVSLGRVIERLQPLGIPIAVISNGSLLWRKDVREALAGAQWVSLKVDAVQADVWRRINRPHRSLDLTTILDGMLAFTRDYRGVLVTETLLVRDVNDSAEHLSEVAAFLGLLHLATAYLAVPTRPPAEPWVGVPSEETVNRSYQLLRGRLESVQLLIGYEGNAFASTGSLSDDLLSIAAVHPMREDAVRHLAGRSAAGMDAVRALVAADRLVETTFDGHKFYCTRMKGVSACGRTETEKS